MTLVRRYRLPDSLTGSIRRGNVTPFSNVTGRYYQKESNEYPKSISNQQLLVLHVAANYKLRRSSMGWWAEGHVWPDSAVTRVAFD
jgi:hypothetical protein